MKINSLKNAGLACISVLLIFPVAYFFLISLLKYEMDVPGPFDATAPLLSSRGFKGTLGGHVNLLLLSGPVTVFFLAIFRVLKIRLQFTENHFLFQLILKKRWLPVIGAAFSASLLGVLFFYLVKENCV